VIEHLPERVRRAIILGQGLPHETGRRVLSRGQGRGRGDGRTRTRLQVDWSLELAARSAVLLVLEESLSLRLAQRTWYRPDFLVVIATGAITTELELHEVKGHWEDDARVKWKVAAEMYPMFTFRAITRPGRGRDRAWQEEVAPRGSGPRAPRRSPPPADRALGPAP
jgi:hypothetical protein